MLIVIDLRLVLPLYPNSGLLDDQEVRVGLPYVSSEREYVRVLFAQPTLWAGLPMRRNNSFIDPSSKWSLVAKSHLSGYFSLEIQTLG